MHHIKSRNQRYSDSVVFVIIVRLIFGPAIFISAWVASVINFIFDWSDGEIFKRAGWKRADYSLYDKILDYYWYCFILAYALYFNVPGRQVFLILFMYRTVGFFIFLTSRKETVFLAFPNFFEIFFYFYLFATLDNGLIPYLEIPKVIYPMAVIIPIVLIREYIVHIKNINLSWFFTGKTTYWIDDKRKK